MKHFHLDHDATTPPHEDPLDALRAAEWAGGAWRR